MIKQALIGLTAAALLAGCGGEDKAQAPAAKAADGTKTVASASTTFASMLR